MCVSVSLCISLEHLLMNLTHTHKKGYTDNHTLLQTPNKKKANQPAFLCVKSFSIEAFCSMQDLNQTNQINEQTLLEDSSSAIIYSVGICFDDDPDTLVFVVVVDGAGVVVVGGGGVVFVGVVFVVAYFTS